MIARLAVERLYRGRAPRITYVRGKHPKVEILLARPDPFDRAAAAWRSRGSIRPGHVGGAR